MLGDEERRAAKQAYKQSSRLAMWSRLGLDAGQLAGLLDRLEAGLGTGCDHTVTRTRAWALAAGLDWPPLEKRLRALGGGCEVLANLDPTDCPL
ncbi:DUF2695 domain-containing protein [Amycolatopsis sp. H6(2020)]|nr:DUF2695 domain-containing protein [Amycolatopsis sp. H6(2020)]